MTEVIKTLATQIGETPVVELPTVSPEGAAKIYLKLESLNPSGSLKDRVMLNLIEIAEEDGDIGPGSTLVDACDQHAGISLAMWRLKRTSGRRSWWPTRLSWKGRCRGGAGERATVGFHFDH